MPNRAQDDPKHDIGIWLPIALADIYTLMLANNGVENVPANSEIIRSWQLEDLSLALGEPTKIKPHKQGGTFGSTIAALFAKELR